MGKKNPLRYRGYYYDTETGMYYLQSRYYNPEIGRFISRDDVQYHEGDTGVKANLYAYCDNNPVMNSDPNGHKPHLGKHLWNKDWFVATIIDVIISAIPVLCAVSSLLRAGNIARALAKTAARMSRKALRQAFVKMGLKLAKATGLTFLATIGGALYDIIGRITGISLGSIIALGLDYLDGKKDNYIFA